MAEPRKVNAAGDALLLDCEGCKLFTYDDATGLKIKWGDPVKGILTAGTGHTGADVTAGMMVTQQRADIWRSVDLAKAAAAVETAVAVTLGDNQFAALSVFAFNVGEENFRSSTLVKLLNQGQYNAVPAQLARWNETTLDGRKIVSAGLVARRAREAALFVSPDGAIAATTSVQPDTVKKPRLWRSITAGGAVLAGVSLPLSTELQTAAGQIQPLMEYSGYIRHAFVGLSFSGAALALYGRVAIMKRHGV